MSYATSLYAQINFLYSGTIFRAWGQFGWGVGVGEWGLVCSGTKITKKKKILIYLGQWSTMIKSRTSNSKVLFWYITHKTVKQDLKSWFMTWWPLSLTFKVDLGVIHIHVLTKINERRWNTLWDMNFGLVTFSPVNFGPVTNRQTESDAYEPAMHTQRRAKMISIWSQMNFGTLSYHSKICKNIYNGYTQLFLTLAKNRFYCHLRDNYKRHILSDFFSWTYLCTKSKMIFLFSRNTCSLFFSLIIMDFSTLQLTGENARDLTKKTAIGMALHI